jgi:hypothetical protein
VVAPHDEVLDVGDARVQLLRDLRDGAVLVEAGHRGEPLARDVGRVAHGDERVRVGRVADHEDPHVVGGVSVERLALRLEDRPVGLEQIGALHALGPRAGADQQGDADAVERAVGVVGHLDAGEQREGAVEQLHGGPLRGLQRVRDLEEAQLDLLVRAEHLARGDAEQQRVADLAGGAGDGDRRGHQEFSISSVSRGEVSRRPSRA